MAYPSIVPPPGYRIARGEKPGAPDELAYYIMRQDDHDAACWREVAGPFKASGGAIQRLDRIVARQLAPVRRTRPERPSSQHRDMTGDMTPAPPPGPAQDRDITERDITPGTTDARAGA